MNKTRRRVGKARRKKARLIREIRNWTCTNWTKLPVRGHLRIPVRNLAVMTDEAMRRGFASLEAFLVPVLVFAGGGAKRGEGSR